MSLEFFIDSASNRNEYQGYLLEDGRGKGGLGEGLTTLPLSCVVCLEILGASTPGVPSAFPGLCRIWLHLYGAIPVQQHKGNTVSVLHYIETQMFWIKEV
jgi:hypothetical protein